MLFNLPPINTVGSNLAAFTISATIEVVVVLPCEPATATANFKRISSDSISPRLITGFLSCLALTSSGLSSLAALVYTITSAPSTFASSWPMLIFMPISLSIFTLAFSLMSEPLTVNPILCSTSAIPLMPIPPMPTKCIWENLPNTLFNSTLHLYNI